MTAELKYELNTEEKGGVYLAKLLYGENEIASGEGWKKYADVEKWANQEAYAHKHSLTEPVKRTKTFSL